MTKYTVVFIELLKSSSMHFIPVKRKSCQKRDIEYLRNTKFVEISKIGTRELLSNLSSHERIS